MFTLADVFDARLQECELEDCSAKVKARLGSAASEALLGGAQNWELLDHSTQKQRLDSTKWLTCLMMVTNGPCGLVVYVPSHTKNW